MDKKGLTIRKDNGLIVYHKSCINCMHVNRLEIEKDFMAYRFLSAKDLAEFYNVPYNSLLNHLHHAGLFDKRDSDLIGQLRHVRRLAYRRNVEFTGDHVLKSIKLEAEITGQKSSTPSTVVNLINVLSGANSKALSEIIDSHDKQAGASE